MNAREPHRIGLDRAWTLIPLAHDPHADAPAACRGAAGQPAATVLGAWPGPVRYERRFNRPTGLTAESSVQLVIEAVTGSAQVALNGAVLGALTTGDPPQRWEIAALLALHNTLVIEIDGAGLTGHVWLELN